MTKDQNETMDEMVRINQEAGLYGTKITYRKVGDKFVFHKDGVYFSLYRHQLAEMIELCTQAMIEENLEEADHLIPSPPSHKG